MVVFLEYLNTLGTRDAGTPIADFLSWRFDNIGDERAIFGALIGPEAGGPMRMLTVILESVDWMHMGIGIIVAVGIVCAGERVPQAADRGLTPQRPRSANSLATAFTFEQGESPARLHSLVFARPHTKVANFLRTGNSIVGSRLPRDIQSGAADIRDERDVARKTT